MTWHRWLSNTRIRLDIVAGLVDGVLNALTLAAGRLLKTDGGASVDLAVRVGAATALTTVFVFFFAHYAELRGEIARAERELNLLSHGQLASSRLGRQALINSLAGASLAALCGLVGAMTPLLLCTLLPGPAWLGLALTIALLGVLGAFLAKSFHGSPALWAFIISVGGVLLTLIGIQIDIAK